MHLAPTQSYPNPMDGSAGTYVLVDSEGAADVKAAANHPFKSCPPDLTVFFDYLYPHSRIT